MSGVATRGYKQNGGFVPKVRFVIAILQDKKLNKTKKQKHKRGNEKKLNKTKKQTKTHKKELGRGGGRGRKGRVCERRVQRERERVSLAQAVERRSGGLGRTESMGIENRSQMTNHCNAMAIT